MQKILSIVAMLAIGQVTYAQSIDQIINATEVERIEKILSADDMQGRRTFTPGIDKAADFIAAEFKKAGLQPVKGDSWFQEFAMIKPKFLNANGTLNGNAIPEKNIVALSSQSNIKVNDKSGWTKVNIGEADTLFPVVMRLLDSRKNYFVTVHEKHGRMFNGLKRFREQSFESPSNIVLVLSNETANTYSVEFNQEITRAPLKNVVGILPGKKKKNEYVIFSGHYDHLGIGKPNEAGDSIFNGANDDASGVTAVILLAQYYAQQKDNERTLVFAAFTAEEVGGFGSKHFSEQFDPSKVMAMFNIEMIGTESKWGTNSAFITGYEKTDMGAILEKNLQGSAFKFYPDPYPDQQLFYRSDNATLARQGVPAHTISTSKMDSEKFYHTQEDEIETLDMKNMTEIIKSIAVSAKSIVAGKDTPSRVDTKQLR
ncbi:M20/M25/M40 family metallo-hydrolase [Pseudobacter ginsenosidimutans]|uniref:Peptidase M28-like protein n=1 Tax=Pseudobacter ginsenosidimutans TaxID=661488 RepID=A0A4Q7MTL8_9BACT|nr:M20/M25/M40 family metallo-hydrolase [Pseudobacter ginsenosidimutans]QEC41883.1 M20/M25/M40 family metallo-hydrolase [Pseudobacter ginsenosidimutans]RZS71294.1 peptidase M28-like protein [Pseudobacter ginsenosidimutans]